MTNQSSHLDTGRCHLGNLLDCCNSAGTPHRRSKICIARYLDSGLLLRHWDLLLCQLFAFSCQACVQPHTTYAVWKQFLSQDLWTLEFSPTVCRPRFRKAAREVCVCISCEQSSHSSSCTVAQNFLQTLPLVPDPDPICHPVLSRILGRAAATACRYPAPLDS